MTTTMDTYSFGVIMLQTIMKEYVGKKYDHKLQTKYV